MDRKNTLLATGAILALVGALTFSYRTQFAVPKADRTPFESLGFAVAEETAKFLGGSGRVVVVAELIEIARNPNLEAQLKGFKAGLAKHPGITLKSTSEIKRPPADDPRFWPPAQAGRIVGFGEGADATVLFMNLPAQFTAPEIAAFKTGRSKLVLVGNQAPVLKPLMQQGIVHLAIVNRVPSRPEASGRETPRQWFERIYQVVTPATVGELQ